jgi:uncharacterized protein YndB with AHSA1/START domain
MGRPLASVEAQARTPAILREAVLDSGRFPPINPSIYSQAPVKSTRFRLLLLAAFLLVFPFFLRRRPRVEQRVTILAPPDAVFPLINDLRNWPLWTAWSERADMRFAQGELVAGAGAEQRWQTETMQGVLRIVKSEPGQRIDYEVTIDEGAYQIIGRIELQPDGACTRLLWKCAWARAENPYRRYVDLLMRWMIRRDFARSLVNLKALVENAESPVEITA